MNIVLKKGEFMPPFFSLTDEKVRLAKNIIKPAFLELRSLTSLTLKVSILSSKSGTRWNKSGTKSGTVVPKKAVQKYS